MIAVPPMRVQSASYRTLTAWRGFAALSVVLYHISKEMAARKPFLGGSTTFQAMGFGFLGVQLFFIISGYCIANAMVSNLDRKQGVKRFLVARLRRIYPPLLWALLVAAACKGLLEGLVATHVLSNVATPEVPILHETAVWYLANLTLTQQLFGTSFLLRVAWTLCYEMAFYLIVSLAMIAVAWTGGGRQRVMDVLHALTGLSLAGLIFFPGRGFYPMDLWPEFGAGILVFDLLTSDVRRRVAGWTLVLLLLSAVFVGARDFPIGTTHESSRLTFVVTAFFAIVLVLLRPFDALLGANRLVRVLSAVGIFSYSLYLLHYLVITGLVEALRIVPVPVVAEAVLLFAAAVTCGYFFYQCCEHPFLSRKVERDMAPAPLPRVDGDERKVAA